MKTSNRMKQRILTAVRDSKEKDTWGIRLHARLGHNMGVRNRLKTMEKHGLVISDRGYNFLFWQLTSKGEEFLLEFDEQ